MATTTTTDAAAAALSMKLLVDTTTRRVLFAEAGKDVVDFLFSLLSLPAATAVKLVGEDSVPGSVGSLYASLDKLDATYVLPGADKDALLCPAVFSPAATANSSLLRLPEPASSGKPKILYSCGRNYSRCPYVTDVSGTECPSCSYQMATPLNYASPASGVSSGQQMPSAATRGAKGFVQGIVTYTVLDDLTVTPMSAISSIAMLNTFAVADLSALQEKTVKIGYAEGVEILKASLQSKTVLTDVFLGKNGAADDA